MFCRTWEKYVVDDNAVFRPIVNNLIRAGNICDRKSKVVRNRAEFWTFLLCFAQKLFLQ